MAYYCWNKYFVASATPLGQERCSWGPSYWCAKYKQAVECNALEHCRAKVWSVKDEVRKHLFVYFLDIWREILGILTHDELVPTFLMFKGTNIYIYIYIYIYISWSYTSACLTDNYHWLRSNLKINTHLK